MEIKELAKFDPFTAMDKLDDEAIVAELQGQIVDTLAYQFEKDGQTVTGLSKAGVDAVCREMAKQGEVIRELELNVLDTGEDYVAHVKAGRYIIQINQQTGESREVLLDTVFGVKRQPKKYDNGKTNPFAYEQAVSKASRNAKMRLLREDLKQATIQLAQEQKKVIRVSEKNGTKSTNEKSLSEAQIRLLYGRAKSKGLSEEAVHKMIKEILGKESVKELNSQDLDVLLDVIEKM
jgi:multidrug efflux pump subunit AcrB